MTTEPFLIISYWLRLNFLLRRIRRIYSFRL
nr:MAG TPA: hypothetical protein [Caudoviricetes sp.]